MGTKEAGFPASPKPGLPKGNPIIDVEGVAVLD